MMEQINVRIPDQARDIMRAEEYRGRSQAGVISMSFWLLQQANAEQRKAAEDAIAPWLEVLHEELKKARLQAKADLAEGRKLRRKLREKRPEGDKKGGVGA